MTLENLYFFIAGFLSSGVLTYVGYTLLNMRSIAREKAKKALEQATAAKQWENAVYPRLENMF